MSGSSSSKTASFELYIELVEVHLIIKAVLSSGIRGKGEKQLTSACEQHRLFSRSSLLPFAGVLV